MAESIPRPFVVLHVAPITSEMVGGLVNSVPKLASAQNVSADAVGAVLISASQGRFFEPVSFPVFHLADYRGRNPLAQLPPPFCEPDLIVFHSTYIPAHIALARWADKREIPYIIAPRGGLSPTAQRIKGFKKRIANALVFKRYVSRALALHCLTEAEAASASKWHPNRFVVGNGTDLPERYRVMDVSAAVPLRLVYIGRLSPRIKGLDLLIDAIALIKPDLKRATAHLVLYGPDDEGGKQELRGMISRHHLQHLVTIEDAVAGVEKERAYMSGDLFLHTSRSEGQPMSVLEAMAHGLPCVVTPGTNMGDVVSLAEAGWCVEAEPIAIANGILEAIQDRTELGRRGRNARNLAGSRFKWTRVGQETLDQYRRAVWRVK